MIMMGELNHFLGLQIKQLKDDIFTNQSKYINDMLKKYGMEGAKPAATPMSTTTKLTKDEGGKEVDEKLFRGMIGSLLYLTASRPQCLLVCTISILSEGFSFECCKKNFQILKRFQECWLMVSQK